jgi:hypothetical protein
MKFIIQIGAEQPSSSPAKSQSLENTRLISYGEGTFISIYTNMQQCQEAQKKRPSFRKALKVKYTGYRYT